MAGNIKNEIDSESQEVGNLLDLADRDARITELAYFMAEKRNFEPGHELDDWLEAERKFRVA